MHRALLLASLFVLAGCLGSGGNQTTKGQDNDGPTKVDNPCNDAYYVGCDENPDALYMRDAYGLHQFTNTSLRVARPLIDEGLVTWAEGGFGDPVTYWAMMVPTDQRGAYAVADLVIPHGPYPAAGWVIMGETPYEPNQPADYGQTLLVRWNPSNSTQEFVPKPADGQLIPNGAWQEWMLLRVRHPVENQRSGVAAYNPETNTYLLIREPHMNDESHFGGPLIDQTIGGGYVFLSMYYEHATHADNAIIAINLTTGVRSEILNVTNHAIQDMDASDDYLVLTANVGGKSGVWAWSIQDGEWFYVQEGRPGDAIGPRVGGDWIVYLELEAGVQGSLMGYHIPSGAYYELVSGTKSLNSVKWDIDGGYLVAQIELNPYDSASPFKYRGSTQLYWMELPEMPDDA